MKNLKLILTLVVLTITNISNDAFGMKRKRGTGDCGNKSRRKRRRRLEAPATVPAPTGIYLPTLHQYAESGNLDGIKKLFETSQVDVNLPDENGRTALWYACFHQNQDIAKYLVAQGAKITREIIRRGLCLEGDRVRNICAHNLIKPFVFPCDILAARASTPEDEPIEEAVITAIDQRAQESQSWDVPDSPIVECTNTHLLLPAVSKFMGKRKPIKAKRPKFVEVAAKEDDDDDVWINVETGLPVTVDSPEVSFAGTSGCAPLAVLIQDEEKDDEKTSFWQSYFLNEYSE